MDNNNLARGARLAALPQLSEGPFYARTLLPTEHGDFDVRVLVDEEGAEHTFTPIMDWELDPVQTGIQPPNVNWNPILNLTSQSLN